MADPVIVPPPPVVNQGEKITSDVDTSPGIDVVQNVFDRVFPEIKKEPTKPVSKEPPKPAQTPKEPVTPPTEPPKPPETPSTETPKQPSDASHKVPSFIEKALEVPEVKPAETPTVTEPEWPDELPTFKTPEESKERYKKWRDSYNNIKSELTELRKKPVTDVAAAQRLEFLENQNREMGAMLNRMGVEGHAEFQQQVIQPLTAAWHEAARIVKESGGDPNDLAKALSLSGKAQFEALDSLFSEMPESAKMEVNEAIRTYRRYDDARRRAIADAPKTMEALRKRDLERNMQSLNAQRSEMKSHFDEAVRQLRDVAKVEILQTSSDPEAKWWNDQAQSILDNAEKLAFQNTDMSKVMMAAVLANMVDPYRKMWLSEREAHAKTKKMMNERLGSEPMLSEGGGGGSGAPEMKFKEDLKRPFADVFLEQLRREEARNR